MKTRLGGRTWAALLTFGLFGQIAWVIENMYFNVFLYNTISGDTSMIAAMVAWSAATATVTTLVMGALSDRLGRRKALIVIGYLLWGVSIGAFAFIKRSPLAGAAHSAAVLVVVLDCVMTFFGSTANDAAFNAWVTDVTVPENRGRVETVLAIMPLVAMLVVFGALDSLTQAGNWQLFFLIVGGITCLGGVLGFFFIREPDLPRGQGSYFANILYGFRPAVIRDNPRLYLSLAALVFIYGESGLGKTHLLYAIANQIQREHPDYNIVYIKGDQFTNELIDAVRSGKNFEFRDKYRNADLFLMDDIQFIAGKDATQEEFFHTFNSLYENKRQIVLTSDRVPGDMVRLEDRLRTRFEWGLIVDVQPPDYETRFIITREKALELGIELPQDVVDYISENITNNVRQIEGTVKKIKAYHDLTGMPLDITNVSRAIKDMYKGKTQAIPTPVVGIILIQIKIIYS